MNLKEARLRAKKLRELIEHHRRLYYEKDKPEISDAAFDTLAHELEELEQKFEVFPGQIKVTVIRETRAEATTKI